MLVREVFNNVFAARVNYLDVIVIPDNQNGFRLCRIFDDPYRGVACELFVTDDTWTLYKDSEVDFVTIEEDNELWVWV